VPYTITQKVRKKNFLWERWTGERKSYHGLLGKGADLLDGAGSALLEADAVALYSREEVQLVFRPNAIECTVLLGMVYRGRRGGLHQTNFFLGRSGFVCDCVSLRRFFSNLSTKLGERKCNKNNKTSV